MKTRISVLALLAIAMTTLIVGASSSLVWADPCTATLSYPVMPVVYSNSNVPIVVPISATCTTNYSQLYATGNAYDATANTSLGSASTVLMSVNGGTEFNGQLGFNLPSSTEGHSIQISLSIYDSQSGNLITATSETVEVGTGVQEQQTVTTTVTQDQTPYTYPTAYPYQTPSSTFQFQPNQIPHHRSQALTQTYNTTNILDYVVIISILAAVIIATTGLVLVARRQPYWPQPQPPLPR
jgi:hypothetical protein